MILKMISIYDIFLYTNKNNRHKISKKMIEIYYIEQLKIKSFSKWSKISNIKNNKLE
jgi:hypothetical protein